MSSGQHSLEDDFFGSLVKKELTPIPCEETCYTFYGPSTKYMPRPASLISLRGLSGNCSDDSTFTVINTGVIYRMLLRILKILEFHSRYIRVVFFVSGEIIFGRNAGS